MALQFVEPFPTISRPLLDRVVEQVVIDGNEQGPAREGSVDRGGITLAAPFLVSAWCAASPSATCCSPWSAMPPRKQDQVQISRGAGGGQRDGRHEQQGHPSAQGCAAPSAWRGRCRRRGDRLGGNRRGGSGNLSGSGLGRVDDRRINRGGRNWAGRPGRGSGLGRLCSGGLDGER